MASAGAESTRSPLFIQSLEKAMKVLSTFGYGDQFLSLGELAETSGLDKAAAQRCAHTLVEIGYLESCPKTSRPSLGKKSLDLGFHYLRTNSLVAAATPILTQLRDYSGERTCLSLFDGTSSVFAIRLPGKSDSYYHSTLVGRRMPTFCSSGGRAMLSRLPETEMRDLSEDPNLYSLRRTQLSIPPTSSVFKGFL